MVSLQGDNGIEIKITTKVDDKELKKFMPQMRRLAEEQRQLSALMGKPIKSVAFGGKEIATAFKNANKEVRSFKMQYLGLMFAGMALQRTFGGVLTSAFQVYNKVTEGTNQAGGAITRLNAAWNFFKFSLIDALQASPFFAMTIEWGIKFVDYLSTIGDDAAFLLVTITAIGGLLAVGGQIMLGVTSLRTALAESSGEAVTLGQTLAKIGGAVVITYAFKEAVDAYDAFKKGDYVEGILGAMEAGALAMGGLKLIRGSGGAGYWFAIGMALKFVKDDEFRSSVMGSISFLQAAINTFADYTGYILNEKLANPIKQLTIDLLGLLQKIASALGDDKSVKNLQDAIEAIQDTMSGVEDFDFGKEFTENFVEWDNRAQELSKSITGIKDSLNQAVRDNAAREKYLSENPALRKYDAVAVPGVDNSRKIDFTNIVFYGASANAPSMVAPQNDLAAYKYAVDSLAAAGLSQYYN